MINTECTARGARDFPGASLNCTPVADGFLNTSQLKSSQSFSAVLRRSPQLRDSLRSNDADPAV